METKNENSTASKREAEVMSTESKVVAITVRKTEQRLEALAEDINQRLKRTSLDLYCIGRNLREAQSLLTESRQFLAWLSTNFEMKKTLAYEYIQVANAVDKYIDVADASDSDIPKNGIIENIAPTALCKLAAPKTPKAARDRAIARAKAGEKVGLKAVKQLIGECKENDCKISNTRQQKAKSQQDELQRVVVERDNYRVQLEASRREIEQLQLKISQLELEVSQKKHY